MSVDSYVRTSGHRAAGFSPAARLDANSDLLMLVETLMHNLVGTGTGSAAQQAALTHLQAGGGRFRARLAIDAGLALELEANQIIAVASAVELLHNASLIHDDLQDRDTLRRDAPAVWAAFGDAVAICAGDLLLSASYAALAGAGTRVSDLMTLLHQRVRALIAGQDADLAASQNHVNLDDYENIAAGKSGPLLALPLELALRLANCSAHAPIAVACGRHFALGYQMFDDLRDVGGDREKASLNAVLVMESLGSDQPELDVAMHADRHFRTSAVLASQLPMNCGRLLAGTAKRLSQRLPHKEKA